MRSSVQVVIRRLFRIGVRLGLLAGVAFALFKLLEARRVGESAAVATSPRDPWPPVPAPMAAPAPAPVAAWVEPADDTCPASHPIKAKVASKIFHRPGGANYSRTHPDRCYATEAAATSDGFTAAKR